jgi:hypothetical protein
VSTLRPFGGIQAAGITPETRRQQTQLLAQLTYSKDDQSDPDDDFPQDAANWVRFFESPKCHDKLAPSLVRGKVPIKRLPAIADTFERLRASHRYPKTARKNILELPTVGRAITSYHHQGFDWLSPPDSAICCELSPLPNAFSLPPLQGLGRLKLRPHSRWRQSNRIHPEAAAAGQAVQPASLRSRTEV